MRLPSRSASLSTSLSTSVALTILALWVAALSGAAFELRWPMLVCVAAAFCPYATLFFAKPASCSNRVVLLSVALAALPFVFCSALLSDDVYRHLFEGRVVLNGGNPFATPPLDPALAHLRDELWQQINHKSIPTIYPVLLQSMFALLAIFNSIFAFKMLAFVVHLLTVSLLQRHASARWALLFGLNPLVLIEGPLSAHHDGLIGLLLLLSIVALQRRPSVGVAFAALAASLKLIGFVALAVFAPRRLRQVLCATALSIAFIVPSFLLAQDQVAGTTHFAHRWQGNAGAYAVAENLVDDVFEKFEVRRHIRFTASDELPELLDPTATFEGIYRGALQRSDLVRLATRILVLTIVFGFALWLGRRSSPGHALVSALWLSLLLSPQFHAWYWLWLLPLACLMGRSGALAASPLLLVTYASHDAWTLARQTSDANGWVHLLLWLVFLIEHLPFTELRGWAARQNPE